MKWFGKKAKDKITGFTGRATGYCQYQTGCNQILLSPTVSKDGAFQNGQWFDEQRITFLAGSRIVIKNGSNPGPDKAAPVK